MTPRDMLPRWPARATATALALLPLAAPGQPKTEPAQPAPAEIAVHFIATDDAGKPLPATAYVLSSGLLQPHYRSTSLRGLTVVAADNGLITFPNIKNNQSLAIALAAPGYGGPQVSLVLARPIHDTFKLETRDPAHPPANAITGRLVNAAGKPVSSALLLVTRVMMSTRSWSSGPITGDAAAMTDDNGRFTLVPDAKSQGTWLEVLHKDYPPCQFQNLFPAADEQTLTIPAAVTIRGRVLHNSKPAPNIDLAISEGETSQSNPPIARATTNDKGEFTFPLIPPDQKWLLFATLNPTRETTIDPLEIAAASPGEAVKTGDLDLLRTITLAGTIKAEGATTPPPSTITLQRFRTGETLETQAAPDGAFTFKNIPKGPYTVYVSTQDPTWHISPKNRAFPFNSAMFLQGTLNEDKPDLTILITQDKTPPVQRRAETLPMRGIEK